MADVPEILIQVLSFRASFSLAFFPSSSTEIFISTSGSASFRTSSPIPDTIFIRFPASRKALAFAPEAPTLLITSFGGSIGF